MQQAIYNANVINTINTNVNSSANVKSAKTGLFRWIACKWDMMAVVSLMVSSAAYGVFALAHVA